MDDSFVAAVFRLSRRDAALQLISLVYYFYWGRENLHWCVNSGTLRVRLLGHIKGINWQMGKNDNVAEICFFSHQISLSSAGSQWSNSDKIQLEFSTSIISIWNEARLIEIRMQSRYTHPVLKQTAGSGSLDSYCSRLHLVLPFWAMKL